MRAIPRRSVISVYSGKERGKLDGGMNEGNSSWRRRFLYVFLELDDTILANLFFSGGERRQVALPSNIGLIPPKKIRLQISHYTVASPYFWWLDRHTNHIGFAIKTMRASGQSRSEISSTLNWSQSHEEKRQSRGWVPPMISLFIVSRGHLLKVVE